MIIEVAALAYTWATGHQTIFHSADYSLGLSIVQHTLGHLAGGLTWEPLFIFIFMASSWFLVNTVTLSLAISFWMKKRFWSVWREGQSLYVMNFLGSAAAAGLIKLLYDRLGSLGSSVVFLVVPIVVVLFQLYRYHISKYEQAQQHITDLNKLYLQTVETLAAAVDAKDRYTHGHIRRVQAFAIELAHCMGITGESELMALRAGALLHDIGRA